MSHAATARRAGSDDLATADQIAATACPGECVTARVGGVSPADEGPWGLAFAPSCPACQGSGRTGGVACVFCEGSGERVAFHRERVAISVAMRGLEGSEAEAEVVLWELFGPDWRSAGWLPDAMRDATAAEVLLEVERSLADGE